MLFRINLIPFSFLFFVAFLNSGCSPVLNDSARYSTDDAAIGSTNLNLDNGITALRNGNYSEASKNFNKALKFTPTSSGLHFLNGLAYQLDSSGGDTSKQELARQGFELSIKFDKSNWLAWYHLGLMDLYAKEYASAKKNFSEAIMLEPENPDLLYHMAFASYYSQDLATASGVLDALEELEPEETRTLEAIAMVSAASNRTEKAKQYLNAFSEASPTSVARVKVLEKRLKDWQEFYKNTAKTSSDKQSLESKSLIEDEPSYEMPIDDSRETQEPEPPDMVVIDVVFISTEEAISNSRGVNLLNGLNIQYGSIYGRESDNDDLPGFIRTREFNDVGDSETLTTSLISIPAINYSLNIANSLGNRNEILARPSLVARSGSTSEFFAGIEIEAGSESAQGEAYSISKEIGVSLEVTPEVEDDGRIGLNLTAKRTFLKPASTAIKFDYAVETSKTTVTADVVMKTGETLILSGLSEKEVTNSRDGVPGLQEIPGIQYVFSRKEDYDFQKSVLILITPRLADYVYKEPTTALINEDNEQSALLGLRAKYLDWFKPYPNTASVFNFMQRNRLYREFRTGDVSLEEWKGSGSLDDRLAQIKTFLYF